MLPNFTALFKFYLESAFFGEKMSAIDRVNPLALVCYFVAVLIPAMFIMNPILSLVAIIPAFLFCLFFVPPYDRIKDLLFYGSLVIIITIFNPLFSHNGNTVLFYINDSAVTLEAFIYGAAFSLMMVAVLLWCKAISHVVTSDKFSYLLGKRFAKLALTITLTLRYIPMLKRMFSSVYDAQISLYGGNNKGYIKRVKFFLSSFSALIGLSLEKAINTAYSMEARGYGSKNRTFFKNYDFKISDLIVIVLSVFVAGFTLVLSANGALDFNCYPTVKLAFNIKTVCSVALYGLFCMAPFVICVREAVKWNILQSKI